jgi:rhodanese-related sulfurtransferase
MNRLRIPFAIVAILLLTACTAPGTSPAGDSVRVEFGQAISVAGGGQYVNIQPEELKALMDSEDVLLVNVKVPYMGHIEDTDLFIPYDQIGEQASLLDGSNAERIVLYCRSGRSSAIAAETLVKLGYENIYNLAGGFQAWQVAGYSLLQNK